MGSILLVCIYIMAIISISQKRGMPKIEKGVLNLSSWKSESKQEIRLDGEWEFYWNALFTYADFRDGTQKEKVLLNVPKVWNQYQNHIKDFPGFGYGTYRLKVKSGAKYDALSLKVDTVSTAYKLFVNNKLLASNGQVGINKETSKPEYRPTSVTFTPPGDEFDIIIQVANFTYARGGIWYEIVMGTPKQIQSLNTIIIFKDAWLLGSLFMMILYFINMFVMNQEERGGLYLMGTNFLLIFRTSLYGDMLFVKLFPSVSFEVLVFITYLTLIWLPVILPMLIEHLFVEEHKGRMSRGLIIYGSLLTVAIAILPVAVYTNYVYLLEGAGILILLYSEQLALKAYLKGKKEVLFVLVGGIIMFVSGVHDVLYHNNIILHPYGEMCSVGMFIFMFLFSFLLAKRAADTHHESKKLSLMLAESLEKEKALTEKLYIMDQIKDEFLASTSHELRTPLNGIINITQSVIKGAAGKLNKKQSENLEAVVSSAKRLYNLINDILDVAAIKNNQVRLFLKPLDAAALVDSILFIMKHLKGEKDIIFEQSIPKDSPSVMADEERLRQILYNLIGNALKFTESGRITIEAEQSGDFLVISVKDTGKGIAKDRLEDIFNSFERLDRSSESKYEGTGLGLFITKRLVELHGGEIWARSEANKGTVFFFTIPVSSEKAENSIENALEIPEAAAALSELLTEEPEMDYYTILAADDDKGNLKALANHLRFESYTVRCVQSGYEVLELLEKGIRFDLVILDVMMPGLSGYQVLEAIRKKYLPVELPVLLLTAKSNAQDITIGFSKGASDYLTKPFEADELLARAKNLVQLKQAVDSFVKVELAFLQAQIKPHFIFNTLSVISALCLKEPAKAKELILDLSDYLRGSFDIDMHNGLTTLSKELELVKAYLSIEQARFKERINVDFDIRSQRDCTMPILSLQPLVENAVRHGIMPLAKGGQIRVKVWDEGEDVKVCVTDNGIGIEEEKIKEIFSEEKKSGSVGLINVNRRLIALYGRGLVIAREIPNGTSIGFFIPITK